MPIAALTESAEMARLADDGCPNSPSRPDETGMHDLGDLWRDVGGSD